MNIELMGDPYAEQILFHHEDLLMPWKRPMEAPKVADIFPQVRQMVMAGKHREAMALAVQRMNEGPDQTEYRAAPNHSSIPDAAWIFRKPPRSKNYLRTVNFENSEIQITWTDEHGDWLRQTFASRPDNVIVQWLTAPAGQSVNVRIALQKSAEWSMGSGTTWGNSPRPRSDPRAPKPASSAGLQCAAAHLQMPLGSLRGQQRLRRSDPRRSHRRLGPDGSGRIWSSKTPRR